MSLSQLLSREKTRIPADFAGMYRSATPLMTNMLPASVGSDGRVNLFVGNVSYPC